LLTVSSVRFCTPFGAFEGSAGSEAGPAKVASVAALERRRKSRRLADFFFMEPPGHSPKFQPALKQHGCEGYTSIPG
jgi:hypothetical protein